MQKYRFVRTATKVISLSLVISLVVGCAQVNTNGVRRHRGQRLPAPVAIVIHDFEPTGSSIGLDTGRETDGENGSLGKEEVANRREVGTALADVLAEELESRGILTSRKSGPISIPPGAMAVGGQVVTVDEGSAVKRVLIGFGSGKSQLSSAAQLYAPVDGSATVVWEYQNTAASGPRPGILTTLPIGIAVQGLSIVVLITSGGMATLGALSSSSTANAKNMAEELADSIEETLKRKDGPHSNNPHVRAAVLERKEPQHVRTDQIP